MKLNKAPEKLVGLGLALLAFAVYLITLSRGACPGASAFLIVSHGGLTPRFTPDSPLWTALVYVIHHLSGENFVFMLNFVSALCGALSVGLIYNLVSEGVTIFIDELSFSEQRRRIASVLAGLAAALCLAFCIPFWVVSNRAHTAAFDILLLLFAARLLLFYMDYGKLWIALIFSFVFGLGVVEFSTFIVVAPVFGAWLLYVMWKRDVLRLTVVLALVACAVLGLLMYLPAAWGFYKTPGYELRQYSGFFDIIWQMWHSQYAAISHGLPKEGWLIILFVSVVPWLAMLSVIRRSLNDERDWSIYFLHAIMTAIMVAVVLNIKISPYSIMGMRKLLVTPYVLISMVYGYLTAYWFLLPSGWGHDPDSVITRFMRNVLGWVLSMPLLVLLGVAVYLNIPEISTRHTGFVQTFAEEVIDSLDGREWLISDGAIDNNLLLAANRKGVQLNTINVMAGNSTVYLDYLASRFNEPRLQNLAKIGIPALLGELMKSDVAESIAVLSMPDIWTRYGFVTIPNKLIFLGTKDISTIDVDDLLAQNNQFREKFIGILKQYESDSGDNILYKWGRRHAGLVANNLGVMLDDLGRTEDSFHAYQESRRIDPENVSSLLNMSAMVRAGRADDADHSISNAVKSLEAEVDKKYHIWTLSRYYGYVRTPDAFAGLGWTWAYSGQPGMAISELEKAEQMLPDESKEGVQQLMAGIFMRENRASESAGIYKDILLRDNRNVPALLGMMRVTLSQKKYDEASSYLAKAAESGMPETDAALQKAAIAFASGKVEKAEKILEDLLLSNRKLLRGWVLMADIAFSTDNQPLLDKCLRRMENIEGDRGYYGSIVRGRRALQKKDFNAAVQYYEIALIKNPANTGIREILLRLDMGLGRMEEVEKHVKALLLEDPDHALALYMRGSIQIADGDFELAEDSLRHSLRSARTPMTLNDLAWVVQKNGQYEEAEKLINEALTANSRHPSLWDTKGEIMLKMKKYDDAVEAFGRSLVIFDKNPSVQLHMAEAHLALGHMDTVKEITGRINRIKDALSPDDREILGRLQMAIRGGE